MTATQEKTGAGAMMVESRNRREGRYAGHYFGVHRRTRETHYDGPKWLWVSRKVHAQLGRRFKRNVEVRAALKQYRRGGNTHHK